MTTVLLVDDDESNVATLSALLEDDGFVVRSAGSCAAVRAILGELVPLDLVLLDQHLPDGHGSDLIDLVRERADGTRILMMSGSLAEEARPKGVDGFFVKGGEFSELTAVIRELLSSRR